VERGNQAVSSDFVLLGLPSSAEQQHCLSVLFLCMYICFTSSFTSTTIPQMVVNSSTGTRTISFSGCLTPLFFFISFVTMDSLILCVMAYDRYAAICHPLHYTTLINSHLCVHFVARPWVVTYPHALLHPALTAHLSFCASNIIHHFFRDPRPLQLSCSDVSFNLMVICTVGGLLAFIRLICITMSYGFIFSTILKITSTQGKQRAFSICGCHLSVVVLFYGTVSAVYFSPSSSHTPERDTLSAIVYTMVTLMLNPSIYSLRKKDMKRALQKTFCKGKVFYQK
uniref:G-protein coupled receptors family 1 profile domain-containing protein n=1 Tax=Loxodonta africana TaxID=9785 RepID=G3TMU0_LOXAF